MFNEFQKFQDLPGDQWHRLNYSYTVDKYWMSTFNRLYYTLSSIHAKCDVSAELNSSITIGNTSLVNMCISENCHKRAHRPSFFKEQFNKNTKAQIWCEIIKKSTNNSKFERWNLPNESLDQKKHVFENLRKCESKLRTSEPRPTFTGSYKKNGIR